MKGRIWIHKELEMNHEDENETAAAGGKTGTRDSLSGNRKELCFSHAEFKRVCM